MIAILHGYLLEGSGSNLWTRSIIQSLCSNGEKVHLVCQENHPQIYDFISEVRIYRPNGDRDTILERKIVYPGACIMHKPEVGETLPVYVADKYEEFSNVQPMTDLDDTEIEKYLQTNIEVITKIVDENNIEVIHANHAVLMSVVAQRVAAAFKIPFAIMPHGSAIEYAVKKDRRFYDYAEHAFSEAQRIYVIGKEIRTRVKDLFPALPTIESKMVDLNLGVNTSLFNPVEREYRKKNISKLCTLLQNVPRGKKQKQSDEMQKKMSPSISREILLKISGIASDYNAKLTDDNAEDKLLRIDWEREKIILFVGRLIANKGLHSIIAALPQILAAEPDTRLVVVGHGPLREPLEALIWALQQGHSQLLLKIIEWGRQLENSGRQSLEEMQLYFNGMKESNELDDYFQKAQKYLSGDRIVFTGYLTHRELCCLFPASDVAVFPSVVAKAGPLVFLEAMASGCFPVGTYFAGMAASIDSVSNDLPPDVVAAMKISPQAEQTVTDIISSVRSALRVKDKYKKILRGLAVKKYDWKNISSKLASDLRSLSY